MEVVVVVVVEVTVVGVVTVVVEVTVDSVVVDVMVSVIVVGEVLVTVEVLVIVVVVGEVVVTVVVLVVTVTRVNVCDAELLLVSLAATVCDPGVPAGTVNVAVNVEGVEEELVTVEGVVDTATPSYLMVIVSLGANPDPDTVTEVPGVPLVGLRVIPIATPNGA